jgi:rfaE bifunctional protein nucleotidyltransferase chain/domain
VLRFDGTSGAFLNVVASGNGIRRASGIDFGADGNLYVLDSDTSINTLADRMAVMSGLAAVDWVVPFAEDTPEALICRVLPDILVKGGDYRPEDIAGGECVRRAGGEVRVLAFRDGRSTSAIVEKIRRGQGPT